MSLSYYDLDGKDKEHKTGFWEEIFCAIFAIHSRYVVRNARMYALYAHCLWNSFAYILCLCYSWLPGPCIFRMAEIPAPVHTVWFAKSVIRLCEFSTSDEKSWSQSQETSEGFCFCKVVWKLDLIKKVCRKTSFGVLYHSRPLPFYNISRISFLVSWPSGKLDWVVAISRVSDQPEPLIR